MVSHFPVKKCLQTYSKYTTPKAVGWSMARGVRAEMPRGVTRYHPVKIDRETLADLRHPGVQKSGGVEFQSRVDGSYHKKQTKGA